VAVKVMAAPSRPFFKVLVNDLFSIVFVVDVFVCFNDTKVQWKGDVAFAGISRLVVIISLLLKRAYSGIQPGRMPYAF
jgi:hypothetical protein